jgi:hypothetical protein
MKVQQYVGTEDLPALYSGAAMLVHPAVYEGFGITTLEAMACETPVAAADIPAIREVAQEAALYFDPADPDSLKAAIVDSVTDDKAVEARVLEGKKRADELSWKQSAAALYEVIEHELKEGPHRRPVIRRLKAFYVATDKEIRKLLGDKAFSQYKPAQAASPKELRALLYRDFLEEQPSLAQHVLLKTYLFTKHVLSEVMKRTYRAARSI